MISFPSFPFVFSRWVGPRLSQWKDDNARPGWLVTLQALSDRSVPHWFRICLTLTLPESNHDSPELRREGPGRIVLVFASSEIRLSLLLTVHQLHDADRMHVQLASILVAGDTELFCHDGKV